MVCHLERQTGPPQIAGPVCGFHTGQSQIWFSGCLQTDRKKKLDGMIVILGDGSFVICLQHPSGLMQGAVKKLYLHPAVPYCFRKPLAFSSSPNMCSYWGMISKWVSNTRSSGFFTYSARLGRLLIPALINNTLYKTRPETNPGGPAPGWAQSRHTQADNNS